MESEHYLPASLSEPSSSVGFVWFRIAVVYFAVAVVVGVWMGASGDMTLYSVHSHLNLIGWQSLATIGLIYHHVPTVARNRIAVTQFWLHNAGLPVMMVALGAKNFGSTSMEPVLAVSSMAIGTAVLLFAVNILFCARAASAARQSPSDGRLAG